MKVENVEFKRFTPCENMALRWKEKYWNNYEKKIEVMTLYSSVSAVIDINNLEGEVEEITFDQYMKESPYCCSIPNICS